MTSFENLDEASRLARRGKRLRPLHDGHANSTGMLKYRAMWRSVALTALVISLAAGTATAQRNIGVQPSPTPGGGDGVYVGSWAVVIGINEYRNERVPKLRYAVNDARSVERLLLAQGFRRDRIITLTDADATKSRIEEALGDRLRRQAGRNDRVLVFFAGHGMTVKIRSGEDEGYLMPVDGDPDRIFSTAISMSALRQISDLIPAKHILYVVDACYSGYAVFNRAIADDLFEEMTKKPAIQILTAGRQGDQAQERAGHGVFTDVLLRGLGGEAFGARGWLALDQLGAWVRERVYAESNKRQIPQFGNLSGDGQFVFMRPARVAAAPPPPPPPALEPTITKEIVREYGTVAIRGRVAGAEVWLDERRLGQTESGSALVVNNVAIGTYRIKARKAG
ncbi:MAG: caspase family protein, partial [Candidatus Rokubacteria bacterium]|nr:caspase family protein [Candidatus Rokubacteria bacterium]